MAGILVVQRASDVVFGERFITVTDLDAQDRIKIAARVSIAARSGRQFGAGRTLSEQVSNCPVEGKLPTHSVRPCHGIEITGQRDGEPFHEITVVPWGQRKAVGGG